MKDEEQFMQHYRNYMAPECHAQMPAFNRVGRGLKGDASYVSAEIDVNGHVILTGEQVDAYNGTSKQTFRLDLTDSIPQLGFRLIEHCRFKDPLDPTTIEKGWFIHFRYKIMSINQIVWEFDTPFFKTGEYAGSQLPDDKILDSSY